jgi:pentatricopeptide repeat protein
VDGDTVVERAAGVPGATTLAYNLVLGCLSRAGRHADAEALMLQMHEEGVPPDAVTFSSLISLAPADATPPSRAAEWLHAMTELGVTPDVQVRISPFQAKTKLDVLDPPASGALGRDAV